MSVEAAVERWLAALPASYALQFAVAAAVAGCFQVARAATDPVMKQLAWRLGAPS